MNAPDVCATLHRPTAALPLLGLTVLIVDDSRLSSEALRLICHRSGARIRRADSLAHARRHLMAYRPACVVVDLGLPDGSGADLIAELAAAGGTRIGIIIGTSGDPEASEMAIAAGADGFLAKPLASVAAFQSLVLNLSPPDRRPLGPRALPVEPVHPDPIAFHDDLRHARKVLSQATGPLGYVAQFLGSVARGADDAPLAEAAAALAHTGNAAARDQLKAVVVARLRAATIF